MVKNESKNQIEMQNLGFFQCIFLDFSIFMNFEGRCQARIQIHCCYVWLVNMWELKITKKIFSNTLK
jgi:hypothetical protein